MAGEQSQGDERGEAPQKNTEESQIVLTNGPEGQEGEPATKDGEHTPSTASPREVIAESSSDEEGDDLHAHGGHHEKEPSIFTAIASAIINFLLMFGLCCAYGLIMFQDDWNQQHRGLAVKMNLASAVLVGGLLSIFSKVPVAIGGPDLNPVVFLGMFVETIADEIAKQKSLTFPSKRRLWDSCGEALTALDLREAVRQLGASDYSDLEFCSGSHLTDLNRDACAEYHAELRATTIFAVTVSSAVFGLLFFCLGRFRLTRFVTYVPTNIMEAFLSCVGYKVFKYALKFCKYNPKQFLGAACIGVPMYFLKALHLGNPAIVIPIALSLPLGIFYIVVLGMGKDLDYMREADWMFSPLENAQFWSIWTDSLGSAKDINFSAWASTMTDFPIMVIVCMLDCMLKLSSTESKLPVKADKDYEIQLYGAGNLLTTIFGSPVGYMQLKFNVINYGVMGNVKDRRGGLIYAILCAVFFFGTTDPFNYLPRLFLSTLLFFAGSGFVAENLWGSRKYLTVMEWLQILVILAVFIFSESLLYAVIVGGLIVGASFIWRYARIPCIVGRPMTGDEVHSTLQLPRTEQQTIDNVAKHWSLVIKLKGFVFFASAQSVTSWVTKYIEEEHAKDLPAYKKLRWVIMDCVLLDGMDSSASKAFSKLAHAARSMGVQLFWSSLSSDLLKSLKNCGTITSNTQWYTSLDEAVSFTERVIRKYIMKQHDRWATLHPMFKLTSQMMKELHAFEPFEDILTSDGARFGCPWHYCSKRTVKASSFPLWQAGHLESNLYLVHSGRIGLFSRTPASDGSDNEGHVAAFGRGFFVNSEALTCTPAPFSVLALEDSELLVWSEEQWSLMKREQPSMAQAIVGAVLRQQKCDLTQRPEASELPVSLTVTTKLQQGATATEFVKEEIPADAKWARGLAIAHTLDKLGFFKPADGSAVVQPEPPQVVCQGLKAAFEAYAKASAVDAHPAAEFDGSIAPDVVGEALLYAGVSSPAILQDGAVTKPLDENSFVALGLEAALAPFNEQQLLTLKGIFRHYVSTNDVIPPTALPQLFREQFHPSLGFEEVDGLASLWGEKRIQDGIDEVTFTGIMSRFVRTYERYWCVLLGIRSLLGRHEESVSDSLTSEMLVTNLGMTSADAEELLWCADCLHGQGDGKVIDMRLVWLMLWPRGVPCIALPASLKEVPEHGSKVQAARPVATSHKAPARKERSLLVDLRSLSLGDNSNAEARALPARLGCRRAESCQRVAQKEASVEEDPPMSKALPDGKNLDCRARLHLFLDYPEYSIAASRWSVFMGMMILVSVITLFAEPLISSPEQEVSPAEETVWFVFELFFTAVFTVEFFLRAAVANALGTQTLVDFFKNPMNICDVVAILPFYIDLLVSAEAQSFRLFRVARLMRLSRLVRLGRLAKRSATFAPIAMILVVIWGIYMKSSLKSS